MNALQHHTLTPPTPPLHEDVSISLMEGAFVSFSLVATGSVALHQRERAKIYMLSQWLVVWEEVRARTWRCVGKRSFVAVASAPFSSSRAKFPEGTSG
jgi:hypothetical protein